MRKIVLVVAGLAIWGAIVEGLEALRRGGSWSVVGALASAAILGAVYGGGHLVGRWRGARAAGPESRHDGGNSSGR